MGNCIFHKREMFQLKCHWVEIKYLGAIQNQHRQLFCRRDNAFSQYALAFASAIATCQHELQRLQIHSNVYVFLAFAKCIQTQLQVKKKIFKTLLDAFYFQRHSSFSKGFEKKLTKSSKSLVTVECILTTGLCMYGKPRENTYIEMFCLYFRLNVAVNGFKIQV